MFYLRKRNPGGEFGVSSPGPAALGSTAEPAALAPARAVPAVRGPEDAVEPPAPIGEKWQQAGGAAAKAPGGAAHPPGEPQVRVLGAKTPGPAPRPAPATASGLPPPPRRAPIGDWR